MKKWVLGAFLCVSLLNAELTLLKEYNDENLSGWVMSEKYDGVRGVWDGKRLLSRNMKFINAPKFWSEGFPPFSIDGELWSKRGEFSTISSIVSTSKHKGWQDIKFMIFDVPNASGDLGQRLEKLENYLKAHPNKFIHIIKQIPINSNDEAFEFLDEVVSGGGEGIVVRDPRAGYENGRSSKILKLKKFKDSECEVKGINDGNGKYKGKMGSINCVDIYSKVSFKIGSGFSDVDRKNPPKIGEIITYKYQNLTKLNKPRFPVYLRIKSDAKF